MNKNFISIGATACAVAVMLGAFGAHALKSILPSDALQSFQTAVNYQMLHGIAIIITGMLGEGFKQKPLNFAGRLFGFGIVCFSGSIFLLTYLKYQQISYPSLFGLITPLGGVLLIAGWICVVLAFLRK